MTNTKKNMENHTSDLKIKNWTKPTIKERNTRKRPRHTRLLATCRLKQDLEFTKTKTSIGASPQAEHVAKQHERICRIRRTNSEPIALVDKHTNWQDSKRTNRFSDRNSHKPFIDAGSDVVEVGRDKRDLILTRLRRRHIVVDDRETKHKGKKTKWVGPYSS